MLRGRRGGSRTAPTNQTENRIFCVTSVITINVMEKMNKKQAEELAEKITRQDQAIESYRKELTRLAEYKSDRDLYCSLATVFALASGEEELFLKSIEAVCQHVNARYFGVFWLDDERGRLVYKYGRGYDSRRFPEIPVSGSFMGDCLYKKTILWESAFNSRSGVVRLQQDPEEKNVLCTPIALAGGEQAVIRIANIGSDLSIKAKTVMERTVRFIASSLERLILQKRNESTLRSLDISFSIARLLEDTLSTQDILKKVCGEVSHLLPCAGCVLAMRDQNSVISPIMSWPENFILSGNRTSAMIYLQNLLHAFPDGAGLIANVHREDKRWSWADPKVKSLCMVPIRRRNNLHGVIIVVGPREETYDHTHASLLGIVAAQTSMTLERASYFQQQEDLARRDGLTGLYNHRMFQEMLREECSRARRYNHPLSLMMFDIDHFKKFNDTYGHPLGDEVIKMVAGTIREMARTTDRAFRYGGEEFAVLLPETASENGLVLAERLRRKIEENRSVKNLVITVSEGITGLLPEDSPESFVKRADGALYSAKESGRNRVMKR
jgi:diguanylate cyclase (GGDEF)-like protein